MADLFMENDLDMEFPSVENIKKQFALAMEEWPVVFESLDETTQTTIDGLLLRLEESDDMSPGLLRQLGLILKTNATNESAQRVAKWMKVVSDLSDFFAESVDIVVNNILGEEDDDVSDEG